MERYLEKLLCILSILLISATQIGLQILPQYSNCFQLENYLEHILVEGGGLHKMNYLYLFHYRRCCMYFLTGDKHLEKLILLHLHKFRESLFLFIPYRKISKSFWRFLAYFESTNNENNVWTLIYTKHRVCSVDMIPIISGDIRWLFS